MEACFGAENVNNDSDADFKSCSATPEFPGDDSNHFSTLPGCNPIQSGPADATKVTGASCSATAISASSATPAAASSASISLAYSSIASPSSVGVMAVTLSSTPASPTPTTVSSAGNNGGYRVVPSNADTLVAAGSTTMISSPQESENVAAASTPYMSYARSYALGSIAAGASSVAAIASSAQASDSVVALTSAFTLPSEAAACGPPITVTFTPTVYVTASPESCGSTVYTTVTNTATVTVPAEYKHVKKHLGMHKH
jgi:hypothetical protein